MSERSISHDDAAGDKMGEAGGQVADPRPEAAAGCHALHRHQGRGRRLEGDQQHAGIDARCCIRCLDRRLMRDRRAIVTAIMIDIH